MLPFFRFNYIGITPFVEMRFISVVSVQYVVHHGVLCFQFYVTMLALECFACLFSSMVRLVDIETCSRPSCVLTLVAFEYLAGM